MTRTEKQQMIEMLCNKLNENPNFYIMDTSGLNSEQTTNLRRLCYKRDITLLVVKNTLLKNAMNKAEKNYDDLHEVLIGTSALMFSLIGNAPARLITEFRKSRKQEKPLLKGAFIEETIYIGEDKLSILENIKSKQELIADIIALLQSPAKNVISALQSGGQIITGILKTISEKHE